jgi:hypothetical protein
MTARKLSTMFPLTKNIPPAPHVSGRALAATLLVFFLAGGPGASSAEKPSHRAGELVAFFSHPHDPVSGHLVGKLVSSQPPDGRGYSEIVLRDKGGAEHAVVWKGSPRRPYFVVDREYDVTVEHIAGEQPASSIVIRDKYGLLFAGATDASPGEKVLSAGLPGFHMAVGATPALGVQYDGAAVELREGESARLGVYEIVCLASRPASGQGSRVCWILTRNDDDFDEDDLAFAPSRGSKGISIR